MDVPRIAALPKPHLGEITLLSTTTLETKAPPESPLSYTVHRQKTMASFSCQICGVDMAIARIRAAHEPPEAAWALEGANYTGFSNYGWRSDVQDEECQDCTTADRNLLNAEALRANWSDDEHGSDGEWLPEQSDTDDEPLEYCSVSEDIEDRDLDFGAGSSVDRSSSDDEGSADDKAEGLYSLSGLCIPDLDERFTHGTWRFGKVYSTGSRNGPFLNDILPEDGAKVSPEHIAAPSCQSLQGINGNALTVAQMKNCRNVRFLVPKPRNWQAEECDHILEEESLFYLSGESNGSNLSNGRYYISWRSFHPPRHDLHQLNADWQSVDVACDEREGLLPLPVHSYCLDVYAKASFRKQGRVDLDGLWLWRELLERPGDFRADEAVSDKPEIIARARRDWDTPWLHFPGDEWLAANPVEVPGFAQDLESALHDPMPSHQDQFNRGLLSLPTELIQDIISKLDVASLDGLAKTCRTMYNATQLEFRDVIFTRMPWLWEVLEGLEYPESRDWPITWDPLCPPGLKPPRVDQWLHDAEEEEALWSVIVSEDPEMAEMAENVKALNRKRREEITTAYQAKKETAAEAWNTFRTRVEHWIRQPQGATTYPDLSERNWRHLYWICDPNTTKVPGLKNRARIWEECEKIMRHVSQARKSTEFLKHCELVQAKMLDPSQPGWSTDIFTGEDW